MKVYTEKKAGVTGLYLILDKPGDKKIALQLNASIVKDNLGVVFINNSNIEYVIKVLKKNGARADKSTFEYLQQILLKGKMDKETDKVIKVELGSNKLKIKEEKISVRDKVSLIKKKLLEKVIFNDCFLASSAFNNVKEIPTESELTIKDVLTNHFKNGFRINSPIELKRFRKFALEYFGKELLMGDETQREEILKAGILFDGKVYALTEQTEERLKSTVLSAIDGGSGMIFYTAFYERHESWLLKEGVISAEMLKVVLKNVCTDYIYKRSYFTNNTNKTIDEELVKCFEQNIILSYEQLVEMLQYIPLATVKWTLSQNPDFIWNTVGTYTHISRFDIKEKEQQSIIDYAEEQTNRKGYFSLSDIPIADIAERNYELSVAALHNSVFRICFDGKYERRGKIVTRKGIELNAFEITKQYCRTLDRCSLEELLAFEKELTGEIHHWISVGAAYSEMVRIDATTFVSKKMVKFDVETIDAVLDDFYPEDYIPLLSVTTFAAFPHVRQPWSHFLLESYVRLFSHKYRFEVLSVNSRNCGAIVRKSCMLDYPAIMTDAVVKATVILNKREVLEFLYINGYIGKRSWSGVETLLKQAKILRERRL